MIRPTATAAAGLPRRLRGGAWGPVMAVTVILLGAILLYTYFLHPHVRRDYGLGIPFGGAMFSAAREQPIPFSHRLHVTDKQIDCRYCHPFGDRSLSAGIPSAQKCFGCHDRIIPEHREIQKLRGYRDRGQEVPWVRVYYNPDHVFFPHHRHLAKGVDCVSCHGEIETVDRMRQVTFYMGFCLACHRERAASLECVACHQ